MVDLQPLLPQQPKAAKKRRPRRRRMSDSGAEEEEDWEVEGVEALLPSRPESAAGEAGAAGEAAEAPGQYPQFAMPGRRDTLKCMQANGFQIWRMQRVRRMHELWCQLAGLLAPPPGDGAAAAGQPPECAAAAAAAGSAFLCAPLPGSEPGQFSRLVMSQVDLGSNEEMAR